MQSIQKKGLSLIVLIITIIVMLMLAGTIIISISNNEIVNKANKAVLKTNLISLQDEVNIYFANNYRKIDMQKEYKLTEFGITDKEFEEYADIAVVKAGKVYIKFNAKDEIKEVAEELNMLIDNKSSDTGNITIDKTISSLKIYGNYVIGVGDKTKNLLKVTSLTNFTETNGIFTSTANDTKTVLMMKVQTFCGGNYNADLIECTQNNTRYSITTTLPTEEWDELRFGINGSKLDSLIYFDLPYTEYKGKEITTSFTVIDINPATGTIKDVMIEEGTSATDYEPYGYKLPVTIKYKTGATIEDKTYNVYLSEPLRKIDDVADYIDLTTGEIVRYIIKNNITGAYEVLSTPIKEIVSVDSLELTNACQITVNTTVIPSKTYVKY